MFVNYRQVESLTSLTRSSIERLELAGDFPAKIRITAGRYAFLRAEIEAWCRDRVAKARGSNAEAEPRAAA